jgi:hypothetical protein
MDMAQIMEVLLDMREDRKADKEMLAEIKADKEEMLAAIKANEETTTRMDANLGSMKTELISTIKNFKFNGGETTACQETMEARLDVFVYSLPWI